MNKNINKDMEGSGALRLLEKIKTADLKGVYTVEMSYIVPFVLMVFFLSIMGIFYYHDKAVIASAAYETVTVASTKAREKEAVTEAVADAVFEERVKGKCIVFDNPCVNAEVDEERIHITGTASNARMKLSIEAESCITKPEETIRNYRKLGIKRLD